MSRSPTTIELVLSWCSYRAVGTFSVLIFFRLSLNSNLIFFLNIKTPVRYTRCFVWCSRERKRNNYLLYLRVYIQCDDDDDESVCLLLSRVLIKIKEKKKQTIYGEQKIVKFRFICNKL